MTLNPPITFPTERTGGLFDPAPVLGVLREKQPICRLGYPGGEPGWLVTSYELARKILADQRIAISPFPWKGKFPFGDPEAPDPFDPETSELGATFQATFPGNMLTQSGQRHIWLRRMHTPYFTTRGIFALRDIVEEIVEEQLAVMENTGPPVDLVDTFALPVASKGACALLGVPAGDREQFIPLTKVAFGIEEVAPEKAEAMQLEFFRYIRAMFESKSANPADDMLSMLATMPDLSDDERVGAAFLLYTAAHQTTFSQLALSVYTLLHDRERWELLLADPSLVESAVEELLRYLSIFQLGIASPRIALEDIELVGVTIKAGESVWVSYSAANRDSARFPDPDRCDLERDASGHIAFGHGGHMCLGQHFARLELRVGLAALLKRFPTLRLAAPVEEIPMYSTESGLYGVRNLPVEW